MMNRAIRFLSCTALLVSVRSCLIFCCWVMDWWSRRCCCRRRRRLSVSRSSSRFGCAYRFRFCVDKPSLWYLTDTWCVMYIYSSNLIASSLLPPLSRSILAFFGRVKNKKKRNKKSIVRSRKHQSNPNPTTQLTLARLRRRRGTVRRCRSEQEEGRFDVPRT